MALLVRASKTFTSLGMKRSGQNLCGDYMYSGHSATLFILMHTIIAYAPKSMKKLRIIVQIIVLLAILSISISHQVRPDGPDQDRQKMNPRTGPKPAKIFKPWPIRGSLVGTGAKQFC